MCGKDTDPYKGNCVGCKKSPGECACRPHSPLDAQAQNQAMSRYTRAQLCEAFSHRYGGEYEEQDIIQFAKENSLVEDGGSGDYYTRFSHNQLFNKLEELSGHLKQASESTDSLYFKPQVDHIAKQVETYNNRVAQYDSTKPVRTNGLTTEQLRSVPSYSYCVHPDVRQALLQASQDIQVYSKNNLLDTQTTNGWLNKIDQVNSNIDADKVLTEIRAYTAGFRVTAEELEDSQKIKKIQETSDISLLRTMMSESSTRVRLEAVRKLGELNALDLLVAIVNRDNEPEPVQKMIVEILGDKEDVTRLRSLLDHKSSYVKARAIQKLEAVEQQYD